MGAVLPDIDAVSYLCGAEAYGDWHHTFGHNVFLWTIFVGLVTWRCRSWRACILSFLAFGSHLLTDAQLSGWKLYLLWPLSRRDFLFPTAVGLESPINTYLVYASFVVVIVLAAIYARTPVEIFSPKLDGVIVSLFRKKTVRCGVCQSWCNQICSRCQRPVCFRHGNLQRGWSIVCPDCSPPRRGA